MTRRLPAACSIMFAVLFSAALLMLPTFPAVDRPGSEIVSHISDHADAIRLQGLLTILGCLALVVVLGYARDRLHGPAGYVFTLGCALMLSEIAVEMWFTTGLALNIRDLEAPTARVVVDIASMWGPILTAADVMVAVPILLAAVDGRLPRWLGFIAGIFAVEQLVEMITIVGKTGSFVSPGGVMNFYVGGPLFVVFFLALGIALSTHSRDNEMDRTREALPGV